LAPAIRAAGFRGSGQSYRKSEGDFRLVINFQRSRWGDCFFVNLGAQPIFIPAEGDADLDQLKEHECALRRRVGREWPSSLSEPGIAALEAELLITQRQFFAHAQTLRTALACDSPEVLIASFSSGTTRARATLHLARAASALGHREKARALADRGIELAGEGAVGLKAELRRLKSKR
jgi:hypothetical protein